MCGLRVVTEDIGGRADEENPLFSPGFQSSCPHLPKKPGFIVNQAYSDRKLSLSNN